MRVAWVLLLVAGLALPGCLQADDEPTTDAESSSTSGSVTTSGSLTTTSSSASTNGTAVPEASEPGSANLTADVLNGTAPLPVSFIVNATGNVTAWALAFGDGEAGNGTTVPATANHTYAIGGNFTANLLVTFADGSNATASLNLTILVPAGNPAPDVLVFEFADSLGCVGDAGVDACVSYNVGPDFPISGIDGYWQALDERYWGLSFTTTVDQVQPAVADSDCAFTDADHAVIGEANNSSSPCAGTVPVGTAFIFLYPYAVPALSQTLTFTV